MTAQSELLSSAITAEVIAKLEHIYFNQGRSCLKTGLGKRRSNIKGNSLDFSDFRNYMAGDDLRKLDWKGYARTQRPNVRLYNEEMQARVNIFIDTSASMGFSGSNSEIISVTEPVKISKLFYSKLIAALLSYVFLKETDIAVLYTINGFGETKKISKNLSSKNSFSLALNLLDDIKADSCACDDLSAYSFNVPDINEGVSVIISDFMSDDGYKRISEALRKKNQHIVLIRVLSPEEKSPQLSGSLTLCPSGSAKSLDLTVDTLLMAEYDKLFANHTNNIKNYSSRNDIMFFDFTTDINVIDCISTIFVREWFYE